MCTGGHLESGESEEHHQEFELRLDRGAEAGNEKVQADHEQLPFLLLSDIETGSDRFVSGPEWHTVCTDDYLAPGHCQTLSHIGCFLP